MEDEDRISRRIMHRLYRIGSGNVDQNYTASSGQNKDKTT